MEQRRIEVPHEAGCGRSEDRAAPRFTLLIRAAKLIAPQGEFACVIRDVSESGISLRGFHTLPADPPLALELQTGEQLPLEPVWTRGHEAGFRFPEPIEVERVVAETGRFAKRKLRLGMTFEAELAFLGRAVRAEVVNISQQGARIRCETRLALAQPLRLVSEHLPEVRARVRWRRDGEGRAEYGLVFDDTFGLGQLALFAARMQAPELVADVATAAALRR
jgi:hypothetical protein